VIDDVSGIFTGKFRIVNFMLAPPIA